MLLARGSVGRRLLAQRLPDERLDLGVGRVATPESGLPRLAEAGAARPALELLPERGAQCTVPVEVRLSVAGEDEELIGDAEQPVSDRRGLAVRRSGARAGWPTPTCQS